jgi:ATPase subunit of ABC transporter with duplicated ATPase domains
MISFQNMTMAYGSKLLFADVSLNLLPNKRYGLVGANGAGKSTLLRILMGTEELMAGQVIVGKGLRVGWLQQDQFLHENDRVIDVVMQGRADLWKVFQEKESLLARAATEWTDEMGYELGEIEEKIAMLGGYEAEALAGELLMGLGVPMTNHEGPLGALSGGYKMRVLLAKALFNQPDILLLDEPTNHLDVMTISWLEAYLKNKFRGTVIFISHDRSFLNNLATHILDIDYGDIIPYAYSYDGFLKEKALMAEQRDSERERAEQKKKKMQEFVDKFKAKASKAKQAQSRMRMIEKMEMPDKRTSSRRAPAFAFEPERESGKVPIKVEDLAKSYDRTLFQKLSLTVHRGDKIAFVGPNGVGKSTLLKIMQELVPADKGTITWGNFAKIGYFAQDHHDLIDQSTTALKWLMSEFTHLNEQTIRGMLGRMLLGGDEAEKPTSHLSGGEAARVLFAHLMLSKPNVLILDEPTNHLDLESVVGLANALKKFEGTVLLVSHDRHFVSAIAKRLVVMSPQEILTFNGSYTDFVNKHGDDYLSRLWMKKYG